MTDREKVIKAVEEAFDLIHSDFIGADDFDETEWKRTKADALAMFKEPEPILLENQHKPYGISTSANAPWISRCPRCGKKVEGKQTRFCKYCGQRVKWE